MKPYLKLILKILVSGLFLWFVMTRVPVQGIVTQLTNLHSGWFLLGVLVSAFIVWSQSIRWREIVSISHPDQLSQSDSLRLTLVGYFFNLFLPSSVGGDAIKSMYLGKQTGNTFSALASSFVVRFMGITCLVLIFWVAYSTEQPILGKSILASMVVITVFALLGCITLMLPLNRIPVSSVRIRNGLTLISTYRKKPAVLLKSLLHTFFMQLAVIFAQMIFFRSVGGELSFVHAALYSPMVNILTMLPVSINGIGIREMAVLTTFGTLPGLTGEICIASTAVAYTIVLLQAVVGGIVFWIGKK